MVRRAACAAWIVWLISLAWMIAMFLSQTLQPNCWPLVILIASQVVTGVLAFGTGSWRLIRGPGRRAAAGWMLLGVAPICLWAGHVSYGIWFLQGRQLDPNLAIEVSRPTCLAIADVMTRILFRQRTEGRYVIMIHNGILDSPEQEVAAMDRHLEQMQKVFGRTMQSKVYWVRGPILGVSGRGGHGWAVGSSDTEGHGPEELTYLDRHEVAHAIMETLDHTEYSVPLDHDVPALLSEGWAEIQSGYPDKFLAQRAWDQRRRHLTLSLRELTNEDWYRRHLGPAYDQGSPLVEYLLHKYDPEKFFELYITCRRRTFDADCQRILGADLDELDREYWGYVERHLNAERSGGLAFVELGPNADGQLWRECMTEHLAAAERAHQLSGSFQAHSQIVREFPESKPSREIRDDSLDLLINGDRWRLLEQYGEEKQLTVAAPGQCFSLKQEHHSDPWQLRYRMQTGSSELDYHYQRQSILVDVYTLLGHYTLVGGEWPVWNPLSRPLLTRIERVSRDGHNLVRISFENRGHLDPTVISYTSGDLYFDPAFSWAIRFADLRDKRGDGPERQHHLVFDIQRREDGPPLLLSHESVLKEEDVITATTRSTTNYNFAPHVIDSEFSLVKYGLSPVQDEAVHGDSSLFVYSLILVLLTLGGGIVTLAAERFARRRHSR